MDTSKADAILVSIIEWIKCMLIASFGSSESMCSTIKVDRPTEPDMRKDPQSSGSLASTNSMFFCIHASRYSSNSSVFSFFSDFNNKKYLNRAKATPPDPTYIVGSRYTFVSERSELSFKTAKFSMIVSTHMSKLTLRSLRTFAKSISPL